jgi:hypothetical protein
MAVFWVQAQLALQKEAGFDGTFVFLAIPTRTRITPVNLSHLFHSELWLSVTRPGCGRASTNTPPNFYLEALAIKAFASNFHLNLPRLIFHDNRCHK